MGSLGFCTSWAVDASGEGREWIEIVELDLEVPNLPVGFEGKRIIHISDLHCSRTVSAKYLNSCVDRVNELDGDIVVLTGDYITHDISGKFRKKAVDIVAGLKSRYGVYASLGNHDYGIEAFPELSREKSLRFMIRGFERKGVNVLRNNSHRIDLSGGSLRIVGLGDMWAGDLNAGKAFADVDSDEAVIVLSHNPDSISYLDGYDAGVVMSGHTHGVGLQFSVNRGFSCINKLNYPGGLYDVGGKKLYVNRGLGRLGRALFNARPEITVFKLRSVGSN
ncbi:MAG TPA: metallophosphoesterase [Sedimentisphaerales bacterium]|nr:metallophosphoesterase [Sedimentisphaerales bacterium]